MGKIEKAIDLAFNEFEKEFGEDTKLEEGDVFVTVFNDAVLVISLEERKMKIKFYAGEPYIVDFNVYLEND